MTFVPNQVPNKKDTNMLGESKSSLYESTLIGAGLLAVSALSNKVLKDSLGITLNLKNAAKIVVGVAISNMVVDYAKKKLYQYKQI